MGMALKPTAPAEFPSDNFLFIENLSPARYSPRSCGCCGEQKIRTPSSRLQGTGLLLARGRERQPQACIRAHPDAATAAPAPVVRKGTSDPRGYPTPWRKHRSSFCFFLPFEKWPCLLIQSLHPRTTLFFCYTSRQRTYVTNAIAIFRRCLSFSFTEPAAKLPFTWQLLMKSERFCKLVLGCFHFPINCPPAIIKIQVSQSQPFPLQPLGRRRRKKKIPNFFMQRIINVWNDPPKATMQHATVSCIQRRARQGRKKFHDTSIRQTGGWVWIDHMASFCLEMYCELIFCKIPSRTELISKQ